MKAHALVLILLAPLLVPILTHAATFKACVREKTMVLIGGREIPMVTVRPTQVENSVDHGAEVLVNEVLPDNARVVLGFNNIGSHAYLWVDGIRFHGRIPLIEGPALVFEDKMTIKQGLMFVFEGIPEKDIAQLRSNLAKGLDTNIHTLSCMTSACGQLEKALGIKLGGTGLSPAALTKDLIEKGFFKDGKPVAMTIIRSHPTITPAQLPLMMADTQKEMKKNVTYLVVYGGAALGYTVYVFVSK